MDTKSARIREEYELLLEAVILLNAHLRYWSLSSDPNCAYWARVFIRDLDDLLYKRGIQLPLEEGAEDVE